MPAPRIKRAALLVKRLSKSLLLSCIPLRKTFFFFFFLNERLQAKSMMVSSSVRVAVCLGVFLFSILVYIATVRSVVPWPTNLYLHDVREIKEPIPINLSLPNYQKAHAKLYQYHKLFSNKTSLEPFSDPQQPATVTTWWQAAALIDWQVHS
ncbi:hypothetical protein EGW08_010908 [Elysia chlorotica]|uniref:Uncharacterized protein n=1 Tax=Elysia chlorotica TaxID=188477 RepID=A0A433TIJ1_ELYCH|nr:hypothetical protein EGW08_010908 [Elysia chlorotica]